MYASVVSFSDCIHQLLFSVEYSLGVSLAIVFNSCSLVNVFKRCFGGFGFFLCIQCLCQKKSHEIKVAEILPILFLNVLLCGILHSVVIFIHMGSHTI